MSIETAHQPVHDGANGGRGAWANQTRAFAVRYVRELFRNKTVLFWTVAFPTGFYLLTMAVFMDTSSIPADVLPYVKSGTAVTYGTFGAIIASLNSFGQQLAMDFEDRRYQLYRSLPISPSADLAGRMVAGVALSVVALAAVLAVSVATGGEFSLASAASVPVVFVAMVAFAVFWMVVAVLITTVVRDTRYASVITVSLAMAVYFLTGYNGGDPNAFQGPEWLLNWLPNTLPTRLIVDQFVSVPAITGSEAGLGVPDVVVSTGVLVAYAAVALVVGIAVMRRVVYQRGVLP